MLFGVRAKAWIAAKDLCFVLSMPLGGGGGGCCLVGNREEAEGADGGGGCCGEEEEAAAEVRRDTSHGLELPPDAGAATGFHDRA